MKKLKVDVFMRQSNALKLIDNMAKFYIIVFKKFPSCRNIVKKIFDKKVRTFRGLNRLLKLKTTAFNINIRTCFCVFRFRLEFHLSNCRDGSQRFAPKSFCRNSENIFGGTYF